MQPKIDYIHGSHIFVHTQCAPLIKTTAFGFSVALPSQQRAIFLLFRYRVWHISTEQKKIQQENWKNKK